MRLRVRALSLLAFCLVVVANGCSGTDMGVKSRMAWPWTYRPPGNIQSQRFNAVAHDPYYDNDAGPEVVGGRPREYAKPLAEPTRSRWLRDNGFQNAQ